MYDFHSYLISFLKHLLIGIYLYTFLQVHSKFPDSIRENRVCCSCHYSCCCSDCSYFQWTWQEHQLRDHCLITADTDTCLFLKNGKCVKNVNVAKKIRNNNTSLFVLWLERLSYPFWLWNLKRSFSKTYIYISSPIKNSFKKNRRGEFTMRLWGLRICLVRWLGFLPFLGEREKGVGCWGKLSSFTYLNCSSLLQHQANWTLC